MPIYLKSSFEIVHNYMMSIKVYVSAFSICPSVFRECSRAFSEVIIEYPAEKPISDERGFSMDSAIIMSKK